jgi:hypothetical protein
MRELRRRINALLDVILFPRGPWAGTVGWHVSGRDWPAGESGLTLDEVYEALDGITPEIAAAAQASLAQAGDLS